MLSKSLERTLLLLVCATLAACASVPFDYPKETSVAIADASDTVLAREVDEWTSEHDGLSGFYPLADGMDALGARLRLLESAQSSVDIQYFLMKNDAAGGLFAAALLRAADRGVRVRFLLDDVFTTADDRTLISLDMHENIEVRLYNPVARGGIFYLNFLADFKRANRRMHNKSFTVDNSITVVGGRNIADEYFELRTDAEFLDFDVIGIGPVAADVSKVFDSFWNHERSVPMAAFAGNVDSNTISAWRADVDADFERDGKPIYTRALDSRLINDLVDDEIALYPANYDVITDDPVKLVSKISQEHQALVNFLAREAATAASEVIVVTPYFVPMDSGLTFWRDLTAKGVRVVVVTNSLASNNHIAVHSGYARHRRNLVDAGVELYEARVDAVRSSPDSGSGGPDLLTLHTKAIVIDREALYVGSLNLDPRSIDINSEMGILVYSESMASGLATGFLDRLPEFAYRVETDERGKLIWRGQIGGEEVIERTEPQSSVWRRFKAWLMKIVPDSQL